MGCAALSARELEVEPLTAPKASVEELDTQVVDTSDSVRVHHPQVGLRDVQFTVDEDRALDALLSHWWNGRVGVCPSIECESSLQVR
jgi:hypothetical protein